MKTVMDVLLQNPYLRITQSFWADWIYNRPVDTGQPHILVVRDIYNLSQYNNHFLAWVAKNHPASARYFRLARLTKNPVNFKAASLLVPWVQDPLKECFPTGYERALKLQDTAKAKGIPVINDVEKLSNSIKSRALEIVRRRGVRAAKIIKITDPAAFNPADQGMSFPFFIREDFGHGGLMHMVESAPGLTQVSWGEFRHPIAVEFIDVRGPDGHYRKYRYMMMGNNGVNRHLIITKSWIAHSADRALTPETIDEEKRFLASSHNPHHDLFNRIREELGFDVVAYDYSYDKGGNLVIWEPNPCPILWSGDYGAAATQLQLPAINKVYQQLLAFYLRRAGLNEKS